MADEKTPRSLPRRTQAELLAAARRKNTMLKWLGEIDWANTEYRDRDDWLLKQFNSSTVNDALQRCQELLEKEGLL